MNHGSARVHYRGAGHTWRRRTTRSLVDADRTDTAESHVHLRPITPLDPPRLAGHAGDPCALLALANAVYGQHSRAWLIGVPALSFGYDAGFSPVTSARVDNALQLIRYLMTSLRSEPGRKLD
jgi:hypothetical protein